MVCTITYCAASFLFGLDHHLIPVCPLSFHKQTVAADYGSYVMIHAYHDRSINRAIDAGIRCVEHGFLMSEETMKRMVKEGIAISIQAVMSLVHKVTLHYVIA